MVGKHNIFYANSTQPLCLGIWFFTEEVIARTDYFPLSVLPGLCSDQVSHNKHFFSLICREGEQYAQVPFDRCGKMYRVRAM